MRARAHRGLVGSVDCNYSTNQNHEITLLISGHLAPGTLPGPPRQLSRHLPKEGAKEGAATVTPAVFGCLQETAQSHHADQMPLNLCGVCYGHRTLEETWIRTQGNDPGYKKSVRSLSNVNFLKF